MQGLASTSAACSLPASLLSPSLLSVFLQITKMTHNSKNAPDSPASGPCICRSPFLGHRGVVREDRGDVCLPALLWGWVLPRF